MGPEVLLVSEELPDLKGLWDLKEMGVTLALLDQLVLREKLECLDYQGNLENLGRMEILGPLDQLEGQEREVFLECLVFLDPKATEDFLDLMEPKEILDPQEKRGRMVMGKGGWWGRGDIGTKVGERKIDNCWVAKNR